MDSEQWKRIDNLLQAALQRPTDRRNEFLRQACAGDESLEREVQSLLASQEQAGSFLELPAIQVAAWLTAQTGLAGQTVSHYKILEMLGAGGMGVVYKALDTKLDRLVALKFLPPQMRHDDELKRRLTDEARAASVLDHANIVTIYEIGEAQGGDLFIAMAFHEGDTLDHRLRERAGAGLPVAEALQIARQVASGLGKAHERGIFHRDIKPSNIIVAKDGVARIIDFGLAKSSQATATLDGTTKGTPLYMSPEQASGKTVDFRTDLWSLGVVLYEMFAGRPPFSGDTHLQVMYAIVNQIPPRLRELRPDLPPEIELIVSRVLEKEVAKRYQSAADMVRDLDKSIEKDRERDRLPGVSGPARRPVPKKLIVLAAAAVLALFTSAYFYLHRAPRLTDKDTIVLADFNNTTGDPVFDETLRQGLAIQLEQSPFLSLISEERIHQVLPMMGRPADARLTPQLAREVCERTASAAVLEGSIAKLGSQYVLGLRARNCRTGNLLDEEQVQAARKEDVLNALSQIAGTFRSRVGESLTTVEKHDTPLEQATTPSLDALKAYSEALKVHFSTRHAAALPLFKHAIELDPKFAMAHAYLGRAYGDFEDPANSAESTRKAYQFRDRTSDREKYFITVSYDLQVTGDSEKAEATCDAWAQAYPREFEPRRFLGLIYTVSGRYEKSLEETKRLAEMYPDFGLSYVFLANNYMRLNRLEDAESALQEARRRKLEMSYLLVQRYDLAFLRGDKVGMEREASLGQGEPGAQELILSHEALALAYAGHAQQARSMSDRAVDLSRHRDLPETAALWEAGAALREAFFGNAAEAKARAAAVHEQSKELYAQYAAAFALALAGDSRQSQTLADDLEKRFGEDTGTRFSYMPVLRAQMALNDGKAAKAIELLQIAVPYELGAPRSSIHGFFGTLYPIYVRGEAFLDAHQGAEAAAEFQKILDHRGIVLSDPIGALARLQLGRAFVLSGDTAKAKAAYQDFLTLWKDADPDIPILKQAKTEYAKL